MKMKRIPEDERVWVKISHRSKKNYHLITSKIDNRNRYFMYDCEDGVIDRLGSARSPRELENRWPL